ncbi:MAG: hypothetical protein ACAI44_23375 [Candidatus Sericytochromatia bacterium]
MTRVNAVNNYNLFFDFNYSFSSIPEDEKDENDIISDLLDIKSSEIEMGQFTAMQDALTGLVSNQNPNPPSVDQHR